MMMTMMTMMTMIAYYLKVIYVVSCSSHMISLLSPSGISRTSIAVTSSLRTPFLEGLLRGLVSGSPPSVSSSSHRRTARIHEINLRSIDASIKHQTQPAVFHTQSGAGHIPDLLNSRLPCCMERRALQAPVRLMHLRVPERVSSAPKASGCARTRSLTGDNARTKVKN